ncbi:hypothetical protein AB205_0069450 [Aquarana catesbeiana]|uniref:Uncharacterized protein n=1 Tax=Aquarana catesbeiana TaxID=8400 RepID=A0A2G9SKK6_AQUCT|nr:hypothetical protein AB205_0069450 [Aquarana catesbeiana]
MCEPQFCHCWVQDQACTRRTAERPLISGCVEEHVCTLMHVQLAVNDYLMPFSKMTIPVI